MSVNDGWVNLINKQAKQNNYGFKIINASISGETTSGGLSRLPDILSSTQPEYLIIELGANDGLRGYKPSQIKNNLLQIITLAEKKNIKVALMKIKITPNYGPRYNKMFEAVFTELATEKNIPLLPFFMESIALQKDLMQKDGLHPNKKAQPLIAEQVTKNIQSLLSTSE